MPRLNITALRCAIRAIDFVLIPENNHPQGCLRRQSFFFQEADGSVPLAEWLEVIPRQARAKCIAAMHRLELMGHELRRPEADYLRDGVYELRVRLGRVNYRMLYFFHRRAAVVVSHGLVKEAAVPAKEIERAIERKRQFEIAPKKHTFAPPGF